MWFDNPPHTLQMLATSLAYLVLEYQVSFLLDCDASVLIVNNKGQSVQVDTYNCLLLAHAKRAKDYPCPCIMT